MNLNIVHEKTADGDVLKISGEVDAYTAPELKDSLREITETEGASVTLDLSQTEYMDSTGIGVIIGAYKATKKHNGSFAVNGLTPRVKRLFDITGLSEIVKIGDVEKGVTE